MSSEIGVGIIGTGFMGACHAHGFRNAGIVFDTTLRPRLEIVSDVTAELAERARARFGFARATDDWRRLVEDPTIAIVAITAPNRVHKEMALAALRAGKHVYCEKPLAMSPGDADELAAAAAEAGTVTLVGYNYLRSPAIAYARRLIEDGEIGDIIHARLSMEEDYMADPAVPISWRVRRSEAGLGALGDLGSHVVAMALHLAGDVAAVIGELRTVIGKRPLPVGAGDPFAVGERPAGEAAMGEVENDDLFHAMVRFQNGATGAIAASWTAWGRKNGLDFDIYGTHGALRFTQERFNELQLFKADGGADNGFRTILTGPLHPPFAQFCPAPGHGLGFNDLKTIEVAQLLAAIAEGVPAWPDFASAARIERVIHAVAASAERERWCEID